MAEFGVKYWAELRSRYKGVLWRVEIAERGFTGTAEEMAFDGGTPLQITWEKRGDEFYVPVKASEATINILCRENFRYLSLFTSDPRQFRVSILRSGQLYWRGYVSADLYSEAFAAPPYTVSVKAVDGFNLLSSIPFRDLVRIGTTGQRTLWELLCACTDLLELDLDMADWMDLHAEGMDENISPLRQTCLDLERLYYVYEEPTYRDILELCLRPFAGQIFQSNGALHIRRAVSLYRTERPMSFYRVGTEYPVGRIITSGGRRLVIHTGAQVITSAARAAVDGMWDGDLHIPGEATLDIVPALRQVTVDVKNKSLPNLIDHLGFYRRDAWTDPYGFISQKSAAELSFVGDDDHQGVEIATCGEHVEQCNFPLTWECGMQVYHSEWGLGVIRNPNTAVVVEVHYGVRIVGEGATYSLSEGGAWVAGDREIVREMKTGSEENMKIEIDGIPCDGEWQFFFRQTLIGRVTSYGGREDGTTSGRTSGHLESVAFRNMSLTLDAGDRYDAGLHYKALVNPANNVDMGITFPVGDIPAVPNDRLLYSLYYLDAAGNPTRTWHTKGRRDFGTLVEHVVQGALRFRQRPSLRITGELFTGAHLDMNTVVRDDKFLHAAYAVNSLELNALDDSYDCELVEMPGLLATETPPEGDDCIEVAALSFTVGKVIRCLNLLLLQDASQRTVYLFDAATRSVREIYRRDESFAMYEADEGFVTVEGTRLCFVDCRGVVQHLLDLGEAYHYPATRMDGYFHILKEYRQYVGPRSTSASASNDAYWRTYRYLNRPEYLYDEDDAYHRGPNTTGTSMSGEILELRRTADTLVINTSQYAYLHDRRFDKPCMMQRLEAGARIVTISDRLLGMNLGEEFLLYRRDSITGRTLLQRRAGPVDCADQTLSEVAVAREGIISLIGLDDGSLRGVKNRAGAGQPLVGLFYIWGDLYLIRERSIHKYIP